MLSFKQFLKEEEDANGERQAGMAASGENTVVDGDVEQKFMGSEKKTTLTIPQTPMSQIPKGHQGKKGGAGRHTDKRLRRQNRRTLNRQAIDRSME